MTTCTQETGKCPICGNKLKLFPLVVAAMSGINGPYCEICKISFEQFPICGGEIKKVWKGGKEVDCVCQKCDKHYGKGYLNSLKIQNSLIGGNVKF